jgi:hypothetical protein
MRRGIIACLFVAAVGVNACAVYDDYAVAHAGAGYGPYGYQGRAYGHYNGPAFFTGSGAAALDPWLAETPEGRQFVSTRFDARRDGRISAETAHHANIWFRRYADVNRDMKLTDQEIRLALTQAGGGASF